MSEHGHERYVCTYIHNIHIYIRLLIGGERERARERERKRERERAGGFTQTGSVVVHLEAEDQSAKPGVRQSQPGQSPSFWRSRGGMPSAAREWILEFKGLGLRV